MKRYHKILGIFRNPAVHREIESPDPVKDHQRMVHLGLCYEFPFDMVRANELALFATYASVSISSLPSAAMAWSQYTSAALFLAGRTKEKTSVGGISGQTHKNQTFN